MQRDKNPAYKKQNGRTDVSLFIESKSQIYYIYYSYKMLTIIICKYNCPYWWLDRFRCCVGPICLFVVYLPTLVVGQECGVSNGCMIHGRWIGNDLEGCGSTPIQDKMRNWRNPQPPEHKTEVLTSRPWCFIRMYTSYAVLSQLHEHCITFKFPSLEFTTSKFLQN